MPLDVGERLCLQGIQVGHDDICRDLDPGRAEPRLGGAVACAGRPERGYRLPSVEEGPGRAHRELGPVRLAPIHERIGKLHDAPGDRIGRRALKGSGAIELGRHRDRGKEPPEAVPPAPVRLEPGRLGLPERRARLEGQRQRLLQGERVGGLGHRARNLRGDGRCGPEPARPGNREEGGEDCSSGINTQS